jgi:hypothetical protein
MRTRNQLEQAAMTKPEPGTWFGIPMVGRGEIVAQYKIGGNEVIGISSTNLFAQAWFADAMAEVTDRTRGHLGARRREIVFSTICAESYLVEWAMDQLRESPRLGRQDYATHQKLLRRYFRKWQSLCAQWEEIPRALHCEGHIADFAIVGPMPLLADFERLVDMRNDITHGNISHPEVYSPLGEVQHPLRTTSADLVALRPGWAIETIAERIRMLHRQVGTIPPPWLSANVTSEEDPPPAPNAEKGT